MEICKDEDVTHTGDNVQDRGGLKDAAICERLSVVNTITCITFKCLKMNGRAHHEWQREREREECGPFCGLRHHLLSHEMLSLINFPSFSFLCRHFVSL